MASPIQAEVLRSNLPLLRQRSLRRTLVDTLLTKSEPSSADRIRIACWSLELGLDVDPISLTLGSNASLYGIGRAVARRVEEILPGVTLATQLENPAVSQDNEVAITLARTAFAHTGGLVEGVALASSLAWIGATAEAEDVLSGLSIMAAGINDKIRVALALSWIQFWVRYEVDEARTTLTDVLAEAEILECDAQLLAELYEVLAGIAFNTAQPKTALEYAERSAAVTGVELSASVAAAVAAASLAFLGRCGESLALIERAIPLVKGANQRLEIAELLVARTGALARAGDVEPARELIQWLRDVAITEGLLDASATLGVVLGEVYLRQGRSAHAARVFVDSSGLLAERDQLGYRPWALAGLARARALAGEEEMSRAALEEVRLTRPIVRHFEMTRFLAEIDVHRVTGRPDLATQCARDAVAWAMDVDMVVDESMALAELFRLEPSTDIAERLGQLCTMTDSRLVHAITSFARAVIDAEPDALLEVSQRFAEMTTWSLAIDAAEAAEQLLAERGENRAAQAVTRTISELRGHCEGLYALDRAADGARLTRRESEIARLAVAGKSTREIAERLFLSSRTVENHLYHVYVKLGVKNRHSLAKVIAPTPEIE